MDEGREYNGPVISRDKKDKAPVQLLKNAGFSLTLNGGSGTPIHGFTQRYFARFRRKQPAQRKLFWITSCHGSSVSTFVLTKILILNSEAKATDNKRNAYMNVYLQVLNLLNTKNVLNVYPATGNPNDDGYLAAPEWQRQIISQTNPQSFRELYSLFVDFPGNYSSPRQIRVGLIFNF
jgi:hypothetical protein